MISTIIIAILWTVFIGISLLIQMVLLDRVTNFNRVCRCVHLGDAVRAYNLWFGAISLVFFIATTMVYLRFYEIEFDIESTFGFLTIYALLWIANIGASAHDWCEDYHDVLVLKPSKQTLTLNRSIPEEMLTKIKNGEEVGKYF